MIKLSQKEARLPVVLIHAGAGPAPDDSGLSEQRRDAIGDIMKQA